MSEQVTINGNTISIAALPQAANAKFTKYLFIKGKVPLTADHKRQLANLGVVVYEYLGSNSYLCRYDPDELQPIRALDFIEYATVYARRVKTSAFLQETIRASQSRDRPEPLAFQVKIVLHKGEEDGQAVVDKVISKTGISPDDISLAHNKITLTASAASIAEIEKIDEVKGIEEHVHKTLFNNLARNDMAIPDWDALGTQVGNRYEGHGQVVSVADTGFDTGSITEPHPAFQGRVMALIPEGRKGPKEETNDFNGHGTHVAGSVLGDGESAAMGGKIRGTAPQASLVLQALSTAPPESYLATPDNLWDLFEVPYKQHYARVATNSWGPDWKANRSQQLPYDSEAGAIDRFVWHNQDHVILFAAGNDGKMPSGTYAHIGSSSAAKNCICVGATESSRNSNSKFEFDPNKPAGQPNRVAAFSSWGPTLEKRLKPDIVAPGVAILSTGSRDKGITHAVRNRFGETKDNLWMFNSGTSMATPLVAGCCAVLREALLRARGIKSPSAALVKALLINGATDLGLKRSHQGFGRINVDNSLATVEGSGKDGVDGFADVGYGTQGKLAEGESWSHDVVVPSNYTTGTFKATLVYSDRYGVALQNNLTLTVDITTASGDLAQRRGDELFEGTEENNVEQVALDLSKGIKNVTITVSADRIARLDDSQGFAVVWGIY